MFALFTVATSAWGVVIWRNRPNSHNIHYLMLALGVFKCLTLLSQVRDPGLPSRQAPQLPAAALPPKRPLLIARSAPASSSPCPAQPPAVAHVPLH